MKEFYLSKLLSVFVPKENKDSVTNMRNEAVMPEWRNLSAKISKTFFWIAVSIITAISIGQLN